MSETETQFLAPALHEEEDDFDRSLRPRRLDEFVGQEPVKEQLEVALTAAEAEVRAATIALAGVQKEAQAGQRTTLEVLNSQQDLTAARARLIGAQRDRVIAAYALLLARAARPGGAVVQHSRPRREHLARAEVFSRDRRSGGLLATCRFATLRCNR